MIADTNSTTQKQTIRRNTQQAVETEKQNKYFHSFA